MKLKIYLSILIRFTVFTKLYFNVLFICDEFQFLSEYFILFCINLTHILPHIIRTLHTSPRIPHSNVHIAPYFYISQPTLIP